MAVVRAAGLLWILLIGHPLPAQGAAQVAGSELSVYLLTMGQGDMVWEKFGHNAIWIRDERAGTDRVYNYGVFDFNSPGYWGRFVRGTWIYQIDADGIDRTMAQYVYLDRTVVAQELNLTPAQKRELQAFLEWNLLPENREYRYDYFRDNCSTRIRDALDRVLGGQLRAATTDIPTETTYRWHSRRLIADDELAYAGMNAGLGPPADQRLSAWEEMFLPEKVREWAGRLQVSVPGGGVAPLVRSERVLYAAQSREPERAEPPSWTPMALLIGAALGGLIALLAAAPGGAGRFGFAAVSSLWSLLAGTGGLLLAALWAATDHQAAHRNENLLQLDPLSLALVLLLPAAAYGARWARRPALWLALAVLGLSVAGLVLQLLPGLDQVNGEVIALALPAHLGTAWAARRIARG